MEVIVIDGSSLDRTAQASEKFGANVITVSPQLERCTKKNLAAAKAKGEFIYFVDSDFELSSNVIERCVKACNDGADAVIVPERSVGNEGFWASCRQLEILTCEGDDYIEAPRFFRRQTFFESKGFDEHLIFGEEDDLNLRIRALGCKVARIKAPLFHHEGPLKQVFLRKYYYGQTMSLYLKKQRSNAVAQFNPFRPGWIKNKHLIMKDPTHATGMFIERAIQSIMAGLGLVASLTSEKKLPQKQRY
ncbi:MAG: glycosyltransferase [Candidatus Bathyarchaeota archaeon]